MYTQATMKSTLISDDQSIIYTFLIFIFLVQSGSDPDYYVKQWFI